MPRDDGYDLVRIVPAPDSSFSVSGVPEGRYLLQIDRPPLRTGAPVHMADCVSAIFTL